MDTLELIKQPIGSELEDYRRIFDDSLTHSNDLLGRVLEHIRSRKGKMMRPILVLLIAKEFGQISDSTHHAAVTLELLHTASLVHDDIVDESNERRGQASVNAEFDNKVAVLVGDYLLSTSLLHASMTNSLEIVNNVANLGRLLSKGEILQLSNVMNETISEESYYEVIKQKTAALFASSAELGAISVGASSEDVEKAKLFGTIVGICFQIKDDIFDYYKENNVGKPTGNDMIEGKLTLPVISALKSTGNEEMKEIAMKVKSGNASSDQIETLVKFTKENGGIEYACQKMDEFCQQGFDIIDSFSNQEVKDSLKLYLNFVVERSI